MSDKKIKGVHIVSDQGAEMMTLEKFGRDGDRMIVQGSLMGAWSSTMFVDPADVLPMIGLLLNWQIIGYMLSLPWILIKNKKS